MYLNISSIVINIVLLCCTYYYIIMRDLGYFHIKSQIISPLE